MMRETLDADAANMAAGGYVSTYTSAAEYYRSIIGGYELTAGSGSLNVPYWLKVVRNANQFTAYASQDGVHWGYLGGQQTITTAQTVYVGFGVGSNSALAQTYTYDSFGKSVSSSGSLTNPFQYTARELDPETNLYYYRARYYDTASGRFIGEDPLAFNAGLNFYNYVNANPTNLADPKGLFGWGDVLPA